MCHRWILSRPYLEASSIDEGRLGLCILTRLLNNCFLLSRSFSTFSSSSIEDPELLSELEVLELSCSAELGINSGLSLFVILALIN